MMWWILPKTPEANALATLGRQLEFEVGLADKPVDPESEESARKLGVWRDDEVLTHDAVVARILAARDRLDPAVLAEMFVAGIGQGRPELRSPVGSYAVAMHLAPHAAEYPHPHFPCATCGMMRGTGGEDETDIFWNSDLWNRFDMGGSSILTSVLCDLEDVAGAEPVRATGSDRAAFAALMDSVRSAPPDSTPGKLLKQVGKLAGKNVYQRTRTLEILGCLGVLGTAEHPGYQREFRRFIDRPGPDGRNDWDYPVMLWRGSDGVDEDAVRFWFGES